MTERRTLGALADDRIAELEAENQRLSSIVDFAEYMIGLSRQCMLGADRGGVNAHGPRIIMEWAREQIDAVPGADNYLSVAFTHVDVPGLAVVATIQRDGMETPGAKAARLQAEVDRLRAVINKAVEDLPE